jgi:hypothetical protein
MEQWNAELRDLARIVQLGEKPLDGGKERDRESFLLKGLMQTGVGAVWDAE